MKKSDVEESYNASIRWNPYSQCFRPRDRRGRKGFRFSISSPKPLASSKILPQLTFRLLIFTLLAKVNLSESPL